MFRNMLFVVYSFHYYRLGIFFGLHCLHEINTSSSMFKKLRTLRVISVQRCVLGNKFYTTVQSVHASKSMAIREPFGCLSIFYRHIFFFKRPEGETLFLKAQVPIKVLYIYPKYILGGEGGGDVT